jgi:hypothetical protein
MRQIERKALVGFQNLTHDFLSKNRERNYIMDVENMADRMQNLGDDRRVTLRVHF